MFKSAATKIAHNSTLTAFAGNNDLRPLQDLITAEKAVLISLQRLSADFGKAADALRTWGLGEGEDLGDTFSASATIVNHFCAALSQYAHHSHTIRDQLKSIRSAEEHLDELRRRRKSLQSKADAAERKLSKMSPEHKNLAQQSEILERLRDEIRDLDAEILGSEGSLGDAKRAEGRSWMLLKFGGLMELCEKGSIVGLVGKQVVSEIPVHPTQPGLPRPLYHGQPKTESLVAEAQQRVSAVQLNTSPTNGESGYQPPLNASQPSYAANNFTGTSFAESSYNPQPQSPSGTPSTFLPSSNFTGQGSFMESPSTPYSHPSALYPQPQDHAADYPTPSLPTTRDDFGITPSHHAAGSTDFGPSPDASGGRFATFPVKTTGGSGMRGVQLHDGPPRLATEDSQTGFNNDDFASSIEAALNSPRGKGLEEKIDGPIYSPPPGPPPQNYGNVYSPPPGPPPGAAPANPWGDAPTSPIHRRQSPPTFSNQESKKDDISTLHEHTVSNDSVGELAYMGFNDEDVLSKDQQPNHGDGRRSEDSDKRVHFGGTKDIDTELQKREKSRERTDLPSPPPATSGPPLTPEEEERALNAAAAREVSRELNLSPPVSPQKVQLSDEPRGHIYNTSIDEPSSPLAPPNRSFTAVRTVSPHPVHQTRPSVDVSGPLPPAYPSEPFTSSPTSPRHSNPHTSQPSSPIPRSNHENRDNSRPTSPAPTYRTLERSGTSATTQESTPIISIPPGRPDLSSRNSGASNAAYSTPPEQPPRNSPFAPNRSATSLSAGAPASPLGPPPMGTRTISASAFRRPQPRMASNTDLAGNGQSTPDTAPLALKKRLPSSPRPSGGRDRNDSLGGSPLPPIPPQDRGSTAYGDFDYIGAYTNYDDGRGPVGSPGEGDYGSLGNTRVTNAGKTTPGGGYSEGRFATNLDDQNDNGLR